MQAESNAESSYRSFLHYFQPALSSHLFNSSKIVAFWVAVIDRFYCTWKIYSVENNLKKKL